jgi:hypothetical protein
LRANDGDWHKNGDATDQGIAARWYRLNASINLPECKFILG